jgi:hypothetical protein
LDESKQNIIQGNYSEKQLGNLFEKITILAPLLN